MSSSKTGATLLLNPTSLEDSMPAPELIVTDVVDRIAFMRQQEETTYCISDYLADSVKVRKLATKPVDEDCRVKMSEWCYQVVDFCKFRRETVGIGMSYLDRYLCSSKGLEALCNRKEYQLAAMTSLYIAIKLHEPLEMETSLLADLSRGCYNEMEFVDMEQTILQALKWRVNGPTALGFVQYFMALIPYDVHPSVASLLMDYARFQLELAVSEQSFVAFKPSEIGFAALLNAIEGIDNTGLFTSKLQYKFIRRIEKSTRISADELELAQAKLSIHMVKMIAGCDYDDLVQPLLDSPEKLIAHQDTESDDKLSSKSKISRRNSPKSVMSGLNRNR